MNEKYNWEKLFFFQFFYGFIYFGAKQMIRSIFQIIKLMLKL